MNTKQWSITILTIVSLFFISIVSLCLGKYSINLGVIINWFSVKLGLTENFLYSQTVEFILQNVRLPRILLVTLVGASLAVSGAVLQSVFKNPLISPFILGISSGAALGVSTVILLFQVYELILLQSAALIFSGIAVVLVLFLSRLFSVSSTTALVLSGVIMSSFFASLVSLIQYFSDDQKLQTILFWTFGSFNNASWDNVIVIAPISIGCISFLITQSWKIDVLSLGQEESQILGINPISYRILLIGITTILVSSVTAICGPIGWVGLLIPHIIRFMGGSNNYYVIVNSFLLGGAFLQIVDLIARNIASIEIPVGIVTPIFGLPFFIIIMYKNKSYF